MSQRDSVRPSGRRWAALAVLAVAAAASLWLWAAPRETASRAVTPASGEEGQRLGPAGTATPLPLLLTAPRPQLPLAGPPRSSVLLKPEASWSWFARSIFRDVPIWHSPNPGHFEIGGLRLGSVVRARPVDGKAPCAGGWFQAEPRGYVCVAQGLRVARSVPEPGQTLLAPEANEPLPFRFVHVKDRSAFLYDEPPTQAELQAVRSGDEDTLASLQPKSMDGGFFLAIEGEEQAHGQHWLRTLHGNYVRKEATRDVAPSKLQGAHLGDELNLPLAFVVEPDAPIFEPHAEEGLLEVGRAERYARVSVDPASPPGERHVRTRDGRLLLRKHVRIARVQPRPDEIEDDARWVHVNLDSQTLVAYEGEQPKFATLVASGLPPRDTPPGTFQIHYKYLTTTMRGEDEKGPFEVQEVPWTMFYEKNYALHGAYWHDAFGAPRSHGCTNMAPLDARWLFHFVQPELPTGWQRAAEVGTHVVFTGAVEDT